MIRACRRSNEDRVPDARRLLELLDLVPLSASILERAAAVATPLVRSLDAIHLASALSIGADLTAFVAYDRRLQRAAENEGLPVIAPA